MSDLFTLGMALDTSQVKKGTKDLDGVTKSATNAEKNLKGVTTASKQTGGAFKSLQGQAANVGYQLQDIAVQAQMGTNAFVIMAQQGGQLLSPFSAVAGILATVAGVAGGLLYSNLGDATEAAKDFNSEIELLSQTVSVNEMGLVSFSDQFGKLAKERPDVAISKIRTELTRADSAARLLSQSVANVFEEEFGYDADGQIKYVTSLFNGLNLSVEQLDNALNGVDIGIEIPLTEITIFENEVDRLQSTFGITQTQAIKLAKSVTGIKTPEGIVNLSNTVAEIASESGGANSKIDQLNVKMADWSVRADNTANSQQALNQSLFDVQLIAKQTESALDENSKANLSAAQAVLSLNQQIEIQKTAMEDGEEAAIRLAAEMALGENVSETLRQKVGDLAVEYYGLKEAEKEAQAQQRALAQEQAQAAREQDQINSRAQKAVEQATLQSMTREEQIRAEAAATIALINASTELNDVQKELAGIQVQENAQKEIKEAAEKGLKNVPSDFAMSVGEALASQDYSSFGNILASQAASFIGTAVTDAVGGSLGGVAGGLVGGAAGAVISQAISDYMSDDLIALERQASQGTGTVLGSIDAKSQSIANSLDYMTEGLDDLINVNTEGFKAMQALVDSIGGASNLVARDFDASGIATGLGLSSTAKMFTDITGNVTSVLDQLTGGILGDALDGVFSSVAGALFGKSKVTDEGINLLGGTIAELIDDDVTQAYQTVTKKSLFSSSRSTKYRFAGDAIEQQFDLTLEAMRDAVTTSAESLGMLPSEIQANLDAFTIEAQKISIKDLSAEEVADELEAVFSSIFDNLASAVVPYVDDFQQAGEGAGETLSRLSTNLSVVDEMLAQLRLGELQGTTQEMLALSEGVVDFFGDASSLASAFTGFVDEFATQERQLEVLTGNLTEALGDQDVAILNSREGVYDYIAALETLDGDNVERIANIISLTDSMDEYFDLLESAADSAMSSLADAVEAENERITEAYDAQREAATDALSDIQESVSNLEGVATSLKNAISQTVTLSAAAARNQLESARNQLSALADSGILPDSDTLDKLLSTVTGDNAQYYASSLDYYREQGRTANDIADLSDIADDQLTETERQIQLQEQALDQMKLDYESQIEANDALIESYQNQYDALLGIDSSVMSVEAAVLSLNSALGSLKSSQSSRSSTSSAASLSSIIDSAYSGNTSSSGVINWDAAETEIANKAKAAGYSMSDIASSMGISLSQVEATAANLGIPAFANGGIHMGGLALVGERGPEIVNMPAGTHVSTAGQTASMLNNNRMIELMQELIDKTIVQNGYVKGSRDILQRVSNGGNSFNTDSIVVGTV